MSNWSTPAASASRTSITSPPRSKRQIQTAIDQADVILFVVDGRAGIVPLDEAVVERLRHVDKPVLCVANKCDTPAIEPQTAEFYKFGQGKVICVSAQQNRGRDQLLDLIVKSLPPPDYDERRRKPALKLAIVGRRNTGKSTFINCLAESERMIVSEVAGTTRDSVDVRFERDGKTFIAIDTAGVRRKRSIATDVEFYSLARAERSIRRADVVLLFFDARLRDQQGGQAAGGIHPGAPQAGGVRGEQVGPAASPCRRARWSRTCGRPFRVSILCRWRSSRRRTARTSRPS